MRLGEVFVEIRYVVDLDNETMVNHANDALVEDITQMVYRGGFEEVSRQIKSKEDSSLNVADIPAFLTDTVETLSGEVKAECHTDDRKIEVKFNAAEWFATAAIAEILALAKIGWGGNYESDYVAKLCSVSNTELNDLFNYVGVTKSGFECYVEEDSAMKWLEDNRPDVAQLLKEIGNG